MDRLEAWTGHVPVCLLCLSRQVDQFDQHLLQTRAHAGGFGRTIHAPLLIVAAASRCPHLELRRASLFMDATLSMRSDCPDSIVKPITVSAQAHSDSQGAQREVCESGSL